MRRDFAARARRLLAIVAIMAIGVDSVCADWRVIDRPGAGGTFPQAEAGDRVVSYFDSATGNTHGFTHYGETWTDLDYPGAVDTFAIGISGRKIVDHYHCDATAWIAVDYNVFHRTTDGGTTWSVQVPPVDVPFRRVSFVDSNK